MDYRYLDMFDIIIFEFLERASLMFQFQIRTQFSLPQSTETNNKNNVFMQAFRCRCTFLMDHSENGHFQLVEWSLKNWPFLAKEGVLEQKLMK